MADDSSKTDLIELGKQLSPPDVQKLVNLLNIPSGYSEKITSGMNLLGTLKKWGEHNPNVFYQGLEAIGRSDLLEKAKQYPWLASEFPVKHVSHENEFSVKSLVKVLKNELSEEDWHGIYLVNENIDFSMTFDAKLKSLLEEGYIASDLAQLTNLMSIIKRNDVAISVQQHENVFLQIPNFVDNCEKYLDSLGKDITRWRLSMRKYLELQNRKVQQMLDDEEEVDLESVFVPLTIIKEKPRLVNPEDETTYNEIEFMRKIARKEIDITPVDFDNEIKEYFPSNPEIWCIIGNPGSGKTFLCHRIGLRFGQNKLPQFSFAVSIPCRNAEWHQMEQSKKVSVGINAEFIQTWLCLSMPVDASWRSDLSQHLVDSDGEGLLIIIDSIDEFTKEVPFNQTILFLLLTRKVLKASTILVTSRPGAYTTISSNFQLDIDRFYQVLGFSPENRDLYFRIQLPEKRKLDQLKSLIHLHDEMNQLSLVPVNASLFAALVRGNDNVSAFTLTLLYTELISYLIRRQLSRMNLKHLAKKQLFPQMHPDVVDCLHRIGEVAYLGVSSRELTSTKDILLNVDGVDQACQCLGLAEEHIKKLPHGKVVRVWCFSHLTIEEFVGANWLRNCSWRDQCLSTRYIVNSDDNFSVFKMVVRFLCGLLCAEADLILSILFKFVPTTPISMLHMPMLYQFNYLRILKYTDWIEFTNKFVVLSEMVFECNCESISESFPNFRRFLPQSLHFYFDNPISPNGWECFVKSVRLLHSIQLLYFDSRYVSPSQFRSLLEHLDTCSLSYLAVEFYETDFSTLSSYSRVLEDIQLPPGTQFSLHLARCNLTDTESAVHVSSSQLFQLSTSLRLNATEFQPNFVQQIGNQLNYTDNLYYNPIDSTEYDTMIPLLCTATQLTALSLSNISGYEQQLQTLLPRLSNLQEIGLCEGDHYSLLPYIYSLSRLKYLELSSFGKPTDSGHKDLLLHVLNTNKHTLRGLDLSHLQRVGLTSWNEFFSSIAACTNLVILRLWKTELQHDDVTLFGAAVSRLRSLVYLYIIAVPLDDIVWLHLCIGLMYHPTIRCLEIWSCNLNSNCCNALTHLIPTLLQLTTLDMKYNYLSSPNPVPVLLLTLTAKLYSVTLKV